MSAAHLQILPARTSDELAAVRSLFLEYAATLGFSLCFQGFDEELAGLPGCYAPPAGELLLARSATEFVGVVALRPLPEPRACEMKRLYVRPSERGVGLGRRLALEAVAAASARGYAVMRLDTIVTMVEARRLYESLGFVPSEAYYPNPLPGAVYLARVLS